MYCVLHITILPYYHDQSQTLDPCQMSTFTEMVFYKDCMH